MYFRSLQIMRGLAAVAVVLYHTQEYLKIVSGAPDTLFRWFDGRFSNGAFFFFVLSGFLMAYLIDSGYDRFLTRRLLRIYPTFWLAAITSVVMRVIVFESVRSPGLLKALSLLPCTGTITYPLGVEWTLIYEVFFYAVCSLFATTSLRRFFPHFLIGWGAALAVANHILHAPTLFLPSLQQIPWSVFNLLFVLGGLTYYLSKRISGHPLVILLGCTTVAACSLTMTLYIAAELPRFGLLGLGFSALILAGVVYDRGATRRDHPGLLERLGDYSYALYLIHVSVLFVVLLAAKRLDLEATATVGAVALAAALVAGWCFGKIDLLMQQRLKAIFLSPKAPAASPHVIPAPLGEKHLRRDRITSTRS